jgi:hypothetical protein
MTEISSRRKSLINDETRRNIAVNDLVETKIMLVCLLKLGQTTMFNVRDFAFVMRCKILPTSYSSRMSTIVEHALRGRSFALI